MTTTIAKALEDQEFFHSSLASRPLPFDRYGAPPLDMPTRGAIPSFFTATEFKPVLTEKYLRQYIGKQPKWGPIGYPTYKRTYARPLYLNDYGVANTFSEFYGTDSPYLDIPVRNEEYWETCARVINGLYHILRCHSFRKNIEFSEKQAASDAQEMFTKLWNFKWLPPGRGLWMMGTRFMYLKGGAALNNCAFISTSDIIKEISEPFTWAMDMSMLGVGVGFDTLGAGKIKVQKIIPGKEEDFIYIADSREGWCESVGMIIQAYLTGGELPVYNYSRIRRRGTPIKGFGGIAEGPTPLKNCHGKLVKFFEVRIGKTLTASDIVDIFNAIGACVVSGNVRRSAQIALGNPEDEGYITLKHAPDEHPDYWNSNNSVYGTVGMDYKRIAELIVSRGEPGLMWLDSARAYGRMADAPNYKDKNAVGQNPCAEQTLHNYELCTLVENFPSLHDSQEEFFDTLKQSYLYAKTVTLVPTHSKKTNRVMGRNSRIGCSLSGLQQARIKFGTRKLLNMLDAGYKFLVSRDENYSDWLQVRNSIKLTSIKPSGTVSLLCGVSAGIHYPIERCYLRRIRFSKANTMVDVLKDAGYRVYPDPEQPESTLVVDFPVQESYVDRVEREVSIWEQMEFDAAIQHVWSDNQVSITVKFDPFAPGIVLEIARSLELYETRLKSVSFLPIDAEDAGYEAAPYFAISTEQYLEETKGLKPYSLGNVTADDLFVEECATGACPVR